MSRWHRALLQSKWWAPDLASGSWMTWRETVETSRTSGNSLGGLGKGISKGTSEEVWVRYQSAFWKLGTPGHFILLEHRGQGVGERCDGPDPKDCGGVRELGACPESHAYQAISGSLGSSQRLSLSLSPGPHVLPGIL